MVLACLSFAVSATSTRGSCFCCSRILAGCVLFIPEWPLMTTDVKSSDFARGCISIQLRLLIPRDS